MTVAREGGVRADRTRGRTVAIREVEAEVIAAIREVEAVPRVDADAIVHEVVHEVEAEAIADGAEGVTRRRARVQDRRNEVDTIAIAIKRRAV